MALAQSPSDTLDITENPEFSQEVQNRINTVANAAIAVLDKNPDAQRAVKNLFGTMVAENLRDPKLIGEIQDRLYDARDARLAKADPSEILPILESFSGFIEKWTEGLAQMNRDVGLSNQAHALADASDKKMNQIRSTYRQILANNHPTHTA